MQPTVNELLPQTVRVETTELASEYVSLPPGMEVLFDFVDEDDPTHVSKAKGFAVSINKPPRKQI